MALLHKATLRPTKLELLAGWLPSQDWYRGTADVVRVASFRFDDPAGAVGIETMLVRSGGPVDAGAPVDAGGPIYQAPLTYRGAPLDGGDGWLIGTTEHSVLGRRWVYDACGDPVYAATLASAILGGGGQAEEFFEVDGRLERREPSMTIASTGGRHGEAPVNPPPHRRASRRGCAPVDQGLPRRSRTNARGSEIQPRAQVLDRRGVP